MAKLMRCDRESTMSAVMRALMEGLLCLWADLTGARNRRIILSERRRNGDGASAYRNRGPPLYTPRLRKRRLYWIWFRTPTDRRTG